MPSRGMCKDDDTLALADSFPTAVTALLPRLPLLPLLLLLLPLLLQRQLRLPLLPIW